MKTIGLLGGMSWESTVGYYRAINEGVKRYLSARVIYLRLYIILRAIFGWRIIGNCYLLDND